MDKLSLPLLLSLVSLVSLVSGAHLPTQNHDTAPPDLQNLLRDLSTKVDALQKENAEQADKLTALQTQLDSQQQEMKRGLEKTEYEMDILRKEREDEQVAFSAALYNSSPNSTIAYEEGTTLIHEHVFTNIGKAYNKKTGIFTAPHRGLYNFDFYIYGDTHGVSVQLVNKAGFFFAAYTNQPGGWGSAGSTATLQLESGDQVYLKLVAAFQILQGQHHYSTFGGQLLFLL